MTIRRLTFETFHFPITLDSREDFTSRLNLLQASPDILKSSKL